MLVDARVSELLRKTMIPQTNPFPAHCQHLPTREIVLAPSNASEAVERNEDEATDLLSLVDCLVAPSAFYPCSAEAASGSSVDWTRCDGLTNRRNGNGDRLRNLCFALGFLYLFHFILLRHALTHSSSP